MGEHCVVVLFRGTGDSMTPLEVPAFIAQPSGSWSQDVLPLLTLAACFPTLHLYWKTRRMIDFVSAVLEFLCLGLFANFKVEYGIYMESPAGCSC